MHGGRCRGGPLTTAGFAVLALALAACGGRSGTGTKVPSTTTPVSSSPGPTARVIPTLPTATTAPARTTAPAGRTAGPGTSAVCGFLPSSKVSYRHVVWIWMENHSYSTVIGSPSAPFENQLASECGLATNYHNITHPSLPNYVAATSGLPIGSLGPFGSDCNPGASCRAGPSVESIFSQVPSWKAYEESMPAPCDHANSGEYAVRHNPPPYFEAVAGNCAANDVAFTRFAADLNGGNLSAFSFITPNLIDDTHDGSVADGDRWLRTNVGAIVSSPAYRAGSVALFVTWDEGEGGSASNCATNTADVGCHVASIVVSPSTPPGTRSATLFNHYSLLRTAEDLLGLPPIASAATATPMESAFGLAG
ncbi:MAG TPA: alkaline phosphatase family protein [Acidimicrobiales bacterium]|nr:alkaline phosphatase family protein [Acidimicrobiales bacterium]